SISSIKDKKMKTRLLFVGEFCSKNPNNIVLSETFSNILNSCDIRSVNFEALLASNDFKSPTGRKLIQSEKSPLWLKSKGFNLISLANNHMYDYGKDGVMKTKNAFSENVTVGSGSWDDAYKVKFIEINGIKIGFFAGTSCDFSALKD